MRFAIRNSMCELWLADLGSRYPGPQWIMRRRERSVFDSAEGARALLGKVSDGSERDGKIVRILTHEEAKRKAVATELRARARMRREESEVAAYPRAGTLQSVAEEDEKRAEELWPEGR